MSPNRAAVALLCGALALLPGCGSGTKRTIPTQDGNRMIRAIQAADQYSAGGQCSRAHTKVTDARFLLSRLPSSVNKDTRQGLADGLSRLDTLIASECAKQDTTTHDTQTDTTDTQTTATDTTPTETTATQTVPTQTQTTQTTPTQTTTTTTTPTTPTTTTGNGGTPPPPGNGATSTTP